MCLSKILAFSIIFSVLIQPLGLITPVLAETVNMEYTDPDHLHAPSEVNGTTYQYDANGNLVSDGERVISWNQDNMPTRIEKDGKVVEFFYDTSGRRILKKSAQGEIVYVNQYYQPSFAKASEGQATKYYFANGRTAQSVNDNLTFLHRDHLGSTVLATNPDSQPLSDPLSYFPYGEQITNHKSPITNYLFTGQEEDSEIDLYNYNARLYNPRTGVFISADTVQGLNRYAYVANNPMMFTDPSGHALDAGGGGGGNNGDEDEIFLPAIMKRAVSMSPRRYFFAPLFKSLPFGFQTIKVDPANDPKLRAFIEKGVRNISQELSLRDVPPTTQDVLKAVSEYVYHIVSHSLDFDYYMKFLTYSASWIDDREYVESGYSKYVPLGEFTEKGACFEQAIFTSVLLENLDPTLDVKITSGRVGLEEPIESLDFSIVQKIFSGGYAHAWVEVRLPSSNEIIVVDPTYNVVLSKEAYTEWQNGICPIGDPWIWEY